MPLDVKRKAGSPVKTHPTRSGLALLGFVLLVAAVAVSGGYFRPGDWYEGLAKPAWRLSSAIGRRSQTAMSQSGEATQRRSLSRWVPTIQNLYLSHRSDRFWPKAAAH